MNFIKALFHSFLDLFRPRILMLMFVPPVASILFWALMGYIFWGPILGFAAFFGEKFLFIQSIPPWMIDWFSITPDSVVTALAGILAILLIVPLAIITSLVMTSLLVMPVVISHVSKSFPGLEKRGSGVFRASVKNLVKSSIIYVILWVITLPLWMIPGVGFAVPIILNGYLNYRIFSYDALGEHASLDEIQALMKTKRVDFFLMGILVSAPMIVIFLYLILPVYGALAFTRLALTELQSLRQKELIQKL